MKHFLLAGVALSLVTLACAKPPSDMQQQIDAYVKNGPGGVAVAWVDADGATFFASGTLSPEDPRAITEDTPFELGSISKVFTSLLLAESERLGKVSRLDPAAKYLLAPDDPAQASLSNITLLSLATHTSGLPRMPSNFPAGPGNQNPYADYDDSALIQALRQDGAKAPAGSRVDYSNFGAAVLGEALGKAWGVPYAEALKVHVLDPLGLAKTSLGLTGSPPPENLAPGHLGGKTVPNWTFEAFAPAGALRSSAREMAQFLRACLAKGDGPLGPAFSVTRQPQFFADDTGGHIGLGWLLNNEGENLVVWHNGATAGSHSFMAFCPALGKGIVILSNIQQPSEAMGFGMLGVEGPKPKHMKVANAADYLGQYPLAPEFIITVSADDGVLRIQATGQPAVPVRQVAPDRFAVVGVAAEISFERDTGGKVTALVLHQNGADQRAPRGEPKPPVPEVVLPEATQMEYMGNYPLAPAFVITVTCEAGGVFAQATGQPRFQIFATAKDEFAYRVVNAQISFKRDESGRVSGLVLHQGGRDLPAKKTSP